MSGQKQGITMFFLRAWMWVVPIVMLVAAVFFAVVAAVEDMWGLFAFMVFVGILAVGMLFFHWWIMYRFGQTGDAK